MSKLKISIIGGGPSALTCAYFLNDKFDVSIYDQRKSVGNKFLVAAKGGFNISNALPLNELLNKYYPQGFLNECIKSFPPQNVVSWFSKMGIKTFEGSGNKLLIDSNTKPYKVVEKINNQIIKKSFSINTNSKFIGFENFKPIIMMNGTAQILESDYYIFSLGGASWKKTGSDAQWVDSFKTLGIDLVPFQPSNCGVLVTWDEHVKSHLGKPLKNIKISCNEKSSYGEIVITRIGLEGKPIYDLIPEIRKSIGKSKVIISLDFKPNNSPESLLKKISNCKPSSKEYRSLLNLNTHEMSIIKQFTDKEDFLNKKKFSKLIKNLQIEISGLPDIDSAISTAGGIATTELNNTFSLKKYPHIFTIGEMVDWDAPTGGFLLQACFSMGFFVANHLNSKL